MTFEDNHADEVQPTKEEWEAFELRQRAERAEAELDSLRNFFVQTEGKAPKHVVGQAIRLLEERREYVPASVARDLLAACEAVLACCAGQGPLDSSKADARGKEGK